MSQNSSKLQDYSTKIEFTTSKPQATGDKLTLKRNQRRNEVYLLSTFTSASTDEEMKLFLSQENERKLW